MIEIVKGNNNYSKFVEEETNTSIFQIAELFYSLLKDNGEIIAKSTLHNFNLNSVEVTEADIIDACKFRLKHKTKKLSYADCIGYIIAKNNKMKFLTGDKQFEKMNNVEYIK